MKFKQLFLKPATILIAFAVLSFSAQAEQLTVYSSRSEHLIQPFFEKFTEETGVKVRYITDKAGVLINRLQREGLASPADILLTVDAGNLWFAARKGLFASVKDSDILNDTVPRFLRDRKNRWFALTIRARTIIFNKNYVDRSELSTYAQLADESWQGRLCLRTSKKVYNQSLVAMLIDRHGEYKAEKIVKGWVNNLAAKPFAKDSQVILAVAAGHCDVGIVNTYYLARAAKDSNVADNVGIFFANQRTSGTHINISGAGVLKSSKNKELAKELLEWLVSDSVQGRFAAVNHEYPINQSVDLVEPLKSWGNFNQDNRPVALSGRLQRKAVILMDRVGYK